jgi:hypothetical protein
VTNGGRSPTGAKKKELVGDFKIASAFERLRTIQNAALSERDGVECETMRSIQIEKSVEQSGLPVAPILLGYVLGPMVEENFRRALLVSRGDPAIFLNRRISAAFIGLCGLVIVAQLYFAVKKLRNEHGSVQNRDFDDATQSG